MSSSSAAGGEVALSQFWIKVTRAELPPRHSGDGNPSEPPHLQVSVKISRGKDRRIATKTQSPPAALACNGGSSSNSNNNNNNNNRGEPHIWEFNAAKGGWQTVLVLPTTFLPRSSLRIHCVQKKTISNRKIAKVKIPLTEIGFISPETPTSYRLLKKKNGVATDRGALVMSVFRRDKPGLGGEIPPPVHRSITLPTPSSKAGKHSLLLAPPSDPAPSLLVAGGGGGGSSSSSSNNNSNDQHNHHHHHHHHQQSPSPSNNDNNNNNNNILPESNSNRPSSWSASHYSAGAGGFGVGFGGMMAPTPMGARAAAMSLSSMLLDDSTVAEEAEEAETERKMGLMSPPVREKDSDYSASAKQQQQQGRSSSNINNNVSSGDVSPPVDRPASLSSIKRSSLTIGVPSAPAPPPPSGAAAARLANLSLISPKQQQQSQQQSHQHQQSSSSSSPPVDSSAFSLPLTADVALRAAAAASAADGGSPVPPPPAATSPAVSKGTVSHPADNNNNNKANNNDNINRNSTSNNNNTKSMALASSASNSSSSSSGSSSSTTLAGPVNRASYPPTTASSSGAGGGGGGGGVTPPGTSSITLASPTRIGALARPPSIDTSPTTVEWTTRLFDSCTFASPQSVPWSPRLYNNLHESDFDDGSIKRRSDLINSSNKAGAAGGGGGGGGKSEWRPRSFDLGADSADSFSFESSRPRVFGGGGGNSDYGSIHFGSSRSSVVTSPKDKMQTALALFASLSASSASKYVFGATSVDNTYSGRARHGNEDRWFATKIEGLGDGELLLMVMDGHGGDEAADFAIDRLPHHLKAAVERQNGGKSSSSLPVDWVVALQTAFLDTDIEFLKESDSTSGACVCAVVLTSSASLYSANAGDARTLLAAKGGSCQNLSILHHPSNHDEKIRIESTGAFVTPNGRIFGQLAVSRSIGDRDYKRTTAELTSSSLPLMYLDNPRTAPTCLTALPFVYTHNTSHDDDFFLVSSDGLFDALSHDEAAQFIRAKIKPNMTTQEVNEVVSELCNAATEKRGVHDDITVILAVAKR